MIEPIQVNSADLIEMQDEANQALIRAFEVYRDESLILAEDFEVSDES